MLAWIVKSTVKTRVPVPGDWIEYTDDHFLKVHEGVDEDDFKNEYPILSVELVPHPDTLNCWFEKWFAAQMKPDGTFISSVVKSGRLPTDWLKQLCKEAFFKCYEDMLSDKEEDLEVDEDHWADTFMGW